MTPEEIAAIRERAEAASKGPWGVYESAHGAGVECGSADADDVGQLFVESYGLTYTPNPADAEFIAHAREDIPALLAEVERLTRQRDQWEEAAKIHRAHAERLDCDLSAKEARLDKVRALHSPVAPSPSRPWVTCSGCTNGGPYPCPTIQCLDGSDQ